MTPRPEFVGTVLFRYGERIVQQVPLYIGESPDGIEVFERAKRHIEIVGSSDFDTGSRYSALSVLPFSDRRFYPKGH